MAACAILEGLLAGQLPPVSTCTTRTPQQNPHKPTNNTHRFREGLCPGRQKHLRLLVLCDHVPAPHGPNKAEASNQKRLAITLQHLLLQLRQLLLFIAAGSELLLLLLELLLLLAPPLFRLCLLCLWCGGGW